MPRMTLKQARQEVWAIGHYIKYREMYLKRIAHKQYVITVDGLETFKGSDLALLCEQAREVSANSSPTYNPSEGI
tara:strand:- start:442 stop:666 length:225 start_codon:yes stop_codon:yes gene_type:complete